MARVGYNLAMAPHLIPPRPDLRSKAERVVWQALRSQLPADALLAANVDLQTHHDRYEADLVVGLPGLGFAVIEVKGGHVQYADGSWQQATSDGMRTIDPARQADRAKRLLDSYARQRGWSHGPLRFESLVAFPGEDFDGHSPDPGLARWALIARGDLDTAADRVAAALRDRLSLHPAPTAEMVRELGDLLGGRGDPQAALLGVSAARDELVQRLTEEQYRVLAYYKDCERVHVRGGPGTGKSWLALEQTSRYAAAGQRVLFVCYSRGLSRWFAQAITTRGLDHRVTVRTFHGLGTELGVAVPDDHDQRWWDEVLPGELLARARPTYDALVVDEAQDFADSWWPPLLALLRQRRLFVAGDEAQAVFAGRSGRPPLELASMTLVDNLRNTVQIAAVVNPFAEERMVFRGGDGMPVEHVPAAPAQATAAADAVVDRLLEQGVPGGHIALLTTAHRHPYHRGAEEQLGKDGYWDAYWMDDEVFYGTVMGFKGLERPVVVLAVDGFHDGVARSVMYAGLSRARDRLIVVADPALLRESCGKEVARRLVGD